MLHRVSRLLSDVRSGEGKTALLFGASLFIGLFAYYVLKTVREPLILVTGGAEVRTYATAMQAILLMGIVPLYARRGTPAYLKALLRLCFEEIADIDLQEHLGGGLRVGQARIGTTTQLGAVRPFTFGLGITLRPRAEGWHEAALAPLGASLRAVIDFAKPAHTCCELHLAASDAGPVHGCG